MRGCVTGGEVDGAEKVLFRGRQIDREEGLGPADRGVSFGQFGIKSDRTVRGSHRRLTRFLRRHDREVGQRAVRLRQAGVRGRVVRIQRNRLLKGVARGDQCLELAGQPVHKETAAQIQMVRLQVRRRLPDDRLVGWARERNLEAFRDRVRDLVLDGKHVVDVAVVPIGPDLVSVVDVDELRGNPQSVPHLPHAALEHRRDHEPLADLADVDVLAFEEER